MNRGHGKRIVFNNDPMYQPLFQNRGVNGIRQFVSPTMHYPSENEIRDEITEIAEIWKTGDQLWKYAEKYYKDSELWWVIAQYNKRIFWEIGDLVYVPMPLDKVLRLFG